MNRRRIKKLREQAESLAAKKRKRDLLNRPCPECGQAPARMIPVDEDTGLDIHTGNPPCGRCRDIQDRYMLDRYNIIQLTMPDPAQDGYDRNPVGPGPDGPAAA